MRKKLLAGFVTLLLFILAGFSAMSVSAASIPNDATQWNGHYYKLYNTGYKWSEAKAYCESLGGHLVTITSAKEQKFLNSLMKNADKNLYWIGLYKSGTSKKWVTDETFQYQNIEMENKGQNYFGMYAKDGNGGIRTGLWYDHDDLLRNDYWDYTKTGFICEWDVEQVSISGASVTLSKTSYIYNGKARTPGVKVVLNGKTLKNKTDYTVTYSNNKNVGTAKVTIKGTGNYKGTIVKTFKITEKKVTPKKVTGVSIKNVKKSQFVVSWKAVKADGYEIQYSTKKSFPADETITVYSSAKTVNYSDVGTNKKSKTITGLKKGTKYYVRVRAYNTYTDENKYGSWSGKINKKTAKK